MEIEKSIFEIGLNLKDPFYIKEFKLDEELKRIDVYVDFKKGAKFKCFYDKRKRSTAYDSVTREWQHLNIWQYKTFIHAKIPRIRYKNEIKNVGVPWSEKRETMTLLLKENILLLSKSMPVKKVSQYYNITDTKIWRMLNKNTQQQLSKLNLTKVTKIGVDETSRRKGHVYLTNFINLDTKKVIFTTDGRNSDTFIRFKEFLKEHKGNAKNIKEVSMDMSGPFLKGVIDNLPNARITYDKFHIFAKVNQALNKTRVEEAKKTNELKNTRYYWLRNPENLTKKGIEFFKEIENKKWDTKKAYEYKLEFRRIFFLKTTEALIAFNEWIEKIENDNLEYMKEVAKTIKEYLDGIINWFKTKINNGILEGTNSMIQLMKTRARGFKNINYFKRIIYLNYGGE